MCRRVFRRQWKYTSGNADSPVEANETQCMSERRGLWSPLSSLIVYELFHHLISARRWLQRFTDEVIRPRSGDRVFDVGCGPGALLSCLLQRTSYVGFDRN